MADHPHRCRRHGASRSAPEDTLAWVLTYLLIALIFGIVNGVIGNLIRIVAFPLYILTLGLIALVVNGLLLLLVSWITSLLGFGLHIAGLLVGCAGRARARAAQLADRHPPAPGDRSPHSGCSSPDHGPVLTAW